MQFEKPDLLNLGSEGDVEDKFLLPLLTSAYPSGLAYKQHQIKSKKNLRSFTIGKGSDQKSYVPDYLVVRGNLPLLVAEAKKPAADVEAAFREARLYANEINAQHPSGTNPVTRVIATNAQRTLAGWSDQAEPVVDLSFADIDPYAPGMQELVKNFGSEVLDQVYLSLLPLLRPAFFWKPVRQVGGLAKQKEQVPINSFGTTITTDFGHLFNPQSRSERSFIAKHAYISSKRRERYIEPIDKVIRAATPTSVTQSKTLEDTANPAEMIKPFRNPRALEQKVMLLIGSAGAGKSTFVDYLQEQALPADIRSKTIWIRIDMNPAPISREEIYPWLREEIIKGCSESQPKVDFSELNTLKAIHAVEVNDYRKGEGRLYEKTPGLYDSKLGDLISSVKRDRHKVAVNMTRYCSADRGSLLIIVLDNSDKRLREEQLLMFEAAQWLQREFRGLVLLPLREETYDNHRNEAPLDTALKDFVFRIEPPLFQRILASRVGLAMRQLSRDGSRTLSYSLPNGMRVEYPASDQGFYLSSILLSIFEHDKYVRRLIVGLSGRNMRRALEIFLDFCTSGHIGTDEITKIRMSEGKHVLPLALVTNVLLRANQRFYDSDSSYLKNVYAAEPEDRRPNFFARLIILTLLKQAFDAPGIDRLKGYVRVGDLRNTSSNFGVDATVFKREIEYLARGFCVTLEDFRVEKISDDHLVAIAPAGHVHLDICSDYYYLAAVAEDSWIGSEAKARAIALRITDTRTHYKDSTVLDNAEDILNEMEEYYEKEASAYDSIFRDDGFKKLVDLSRARSKLQRFEREIVAEQWVGAQKRFPAGSTIATTVLAIIEFGVLVMLGPGVRGLVHHTKLPAGFRQMNEFQAGSPIKVRILTVDRVARRAELEVDTAS